VGELADGRRIGEKEGWQEGISEGRRLQGWRHREKQIGSCAGWWLGDFGIGKIGKFPPVWEVESDRDFSVKKEGVSLERFRTEYGKL